MDVVEEHSRGAITVTIVSQSLTNIRHQQVRPTVAVHVCDRSGPSALPAGTEGPGRLECAVAITQQYADQALVTIAALVRQGNVRLAVPVQICDSYGV